MFESFSAQERHRRVPFGLWLGGFYLLLCLGVSAYTAFTAKPENVGYDWIWFTILVLPWSMLGPLGAIYGVFINAALLAASATLAQRLIRRFRAR